MDRSNKLRSLVYVLTFLLTLAICFITILIIIKCFEIFNKQRRRRRHWCLFFCCLRSKSRQHRHHRDRNNINTNSDTNNNTRINNGLSLSCTSISSMSSSYSSDSSSDSSSSSSSSLPPSPTPSSSYRSCNLNPTTTNSYDNFAFKNEIDNNKRKKVIINRKYDDTSRHINKTVEPKIISIPDTSTVIVNQQINSISSLIESKATTTTMPVVLESLGLINKNYSSSNFNNNNAVQLEVANLERRATFHHETLSSINNDFNKHFLHNSNSLNSRMKPRTITATLNDNNSDNCSQILDQCNFINIDLDESNEIPPDYDQVVNK
jgi:hypothetical protein